MKAREAIEVGQDSEERPLPMPDLSGRGPRQIPGSLSDSAPTDDRAGKRHLLERAKQLFEERRLRLRIFGRAMFGEPAWDILLSLYICADQGGHQTLSSLSRFTGAPPTTVQRWLDYLETRGWVERDKFSTDRRLTHVEMTQAGIDTLEAYLTALHEG